MGEQGILLLKIVRAEMKTDADLFGKMDPFVVVDYEGQEFKTNVKDGAGKTPVWN